MTRCGPGAHRTDPPERGDHVLSVAPVTIL